MVGSVVGLVVGWLVWLVGFGTAHYNCLYRSDKSSDFRLKLFFVGKDHITFSSPSLDQTRQDSTDFTK